MIKDNNYINIYLWILLISFISVCSFSNAQSQKSKYIGIGFEALDYERESGFEVSDKAYLLLDSIVNECKNRIIVKDSYTENEAVEILATIGSVIKGFNIKYDTLGLYSIALEKKLMDCKFFSLTYLTVGEKLSLPLNSMDAPKHIFVYWKDKEKEIYWEATSHGKNTKQHYIDSLKINEISIKFKVYLNPLNFKISKSLIYNYCGYYKSNIGMITEAVLDYDEAIRLNPNAADCYYSRGTSKAELNDNKGAIFDYDEAIRLNPQEANFYSNRGISKAKLNDNNGAILDYDEAIRLNPNESDFYSNRGFSKAKLNDNKGAILDYNEAIRLNPDVAGYYANRGISNAALKNYIGAILDYNEAIKLKPEDAKYYCNRGISKAALKNYNGAILDYNEAIKLKPKDAIYYYNRGAENLNLNKKSDACLDFKKAKELGLKEAEEAIKLYCK